MWTWLCAATAGLLGSTRGADGGSRCGMAEWPCRSELQCVSLDRYCDGVRDCEDGSDEPPGCSRESQSIEIYDCIIDGSLSVNQLPFLIRHNEC